MTPERWRQIEENFEAVADCATAERVEVLDRACAADLDLRREVESLLAAQAGEQELMAALLSSPPAHSPPRTRKTSPDSGSAPIARPHRRRRDGSGLPGGAR